LPWLVVLPSAEKRFLNRPMWCWFGDNLKTALDSGGFFVPKIRAYELAGRNRRTSKKYQIILYKSLAI
jgi:hypothetical protein